MIDDIETDFTKIETQNRANILKIGTLLSRLF